MLEIRNDVNEFYVTQHNTRWGVVLHHTPPKIEYIPRPNSPYGDLEKRTPGYVLVQEYTYKNQSRAWIVPIEIWGYHTPYPKVGDIIHFVLIGGKNTVADYEGFADFHQSPGLVQHHALLAAGKEG